MDRRIFVENSKRRIEDVFVVIKTTMWHVFFGTLRVSLIHLCCIIVYAMHATRKKVTLTVLIYNIVLVVDFFFHCLVCVADFESFSISFALILRPIATNVIRRPDSYSLNREKRSQRKFCAPKKSSDNSFSRCIWSIFLFWFFYAHDSRKWLRQKKNSKSLKAIWHIEHSHCVRSLFLFLLLAVSGLIRWFHPRRDPSEE